MRTRPDVELDAARAQVLRIVLALETDVAQQAGQQGQVQLIVGGRGLVEAPALFLDDGQQLRMDIAPFTQAQLRKEILAAMFLQLAIRFLVRDGLFEPLPDLEIAGKFRLLVGEFLVGVIGRILRIHGPVARVLHRDRCGDDEQFGQTGIVAAGQDHAAHARIQRQAGQLLAQRRQAIDAALLFHRPQFLQELVAVGNGAAQRRFDEGEALHIRQMQRLHAQDDRGQRRAQDLGIGELGALQEILLVIQADAHARRHPAASAGTLVGGRLRYRLDLQLFDLVAIAVTLHTGETGIDHIADSRHGQ